MSYFEARSEDGEVWIKVFSSEERRVIWERMTPGDAVRLSRALVKAAAEALGVSV